MLLSRRILYGLTSAVALLFIMTLTALNSGRYKDSLERFGLTGSTISLPKEIPFTPKVDHKLEDMSHLVMVPCHAIWKGPDKASWFVNEKYKDELDSYIHHIEEGVRVAKGDEHALLLYSGGYTQRTAGPMGEGQSYWQMANFLGLLDDESVERRTMTEDFARDSFENLLFSIARFHEITKRYPSQITVVGFDFKKDRFEKLHAAALQFPLDHFHYVGSDPVNMEGVKESEYANAYKLFEHDPFGCKDPIIIRKRIERNPFRRFHSYAVSCPELVDFFKICTHPDGKNATDVRAPWIHSH